MNAEDLLVSRFNLNRGKYSMFVGAGISVSAGVPLATLDLPRLPSIVSCIRRDFYNSHNGTPLSDSKLLAWYSDQKLLQRPDTIYSDALNLIGDTPRTRQEYLRKFFERKQPGPSHISIARLVEKECLEIMFTTNFDSMTEGAIRKNGNCLEPKVAAHSQTIADILLSEPGPKIVKLHGDYLYSDIKNTTSETNNLEKNIRDKLRSLLRERGLIVVGYSGNDHTVMSTLEQMAFDGDFFPYGLYWLQLDGSAPTKRVVQFVETVGGLLLTIPGADILLQGLATRVGKC